MNTQSPAGPAQRPNLPDAAVKHLELALDEAARTRLDQLDRLPASQDDLVVAAQRSALHQTLVEITAAQERIAAATFGTCTHCHRSISLERLEFRPWSATCVGCTGR
ncbi:MAG: hypothetical protein WBP61_05980 [Nocardioides sp.]